MAGLLNFVKKLVSKLADYHHAIKGIIVALITIGLDQIVEVAVFKCPCIEEADLYIPCTNALNSCPRKNKELYGHMFIWAPLGVLLLAGLTFNGIVWKEITSCCRNYKIDWKVKFFNFCKIFGFALIAPLVWMIISFLDGDYYACACTLMPYRFIKVPPMNQTCKDIKVLVMSNDYIANKQYSQTIGWIMSLVISLGTWICYALYRSCWSDTYIQSTLNNKFREAVEKSLSETFLNVMNDKIATTEASFKTLKQENREEWKKKFWKNLQFTMHHDFDATTFDPEAPFQTGPET